LIRRVGFAVAALLIVASLVFWFTLPDVRPLRTSWPKTTAFMERRRAELARTGEPTRLEWLPVPLARISPNLQHAVVAAEDARFYEHEGIDWDALRSAAEKDWEKRRFAAGASTITQQLAKNLYLSPTRTPWRKLKEWAIARRLEKALSKGRILELYLNVVEFGRRTYGAEAAARRYFGGPAASLTPHEAAVLAAVIASPRIYDPVRHASRVERRARRILRWMRAVEPVPSGAPGPTPTLATTRQPTTVPSQAE
jgi:monofunctional biosynthetic peptidoglycan transglycosylase